MQIVAMAPRHIAALAELERVCFPAPWSEQALREELGLNGSVISRYFRWLGGFVTGDPGVSYNYRCPVSELLAEIAEKRR